MDFESSLFFVDMKLYPGYLTLLMYATYVFSCFTFRNSFLSIYGIMVPASAVPPFRFYRRSSYHPHNEQSGAFVFPVHGRIHSAWYSQATGLVILLAEPLPGFLQTFPKPLLLLAEIYGWVILPVHFFLSPYKAMPFSIKAGHSRNKFFIPFRFWVLCCQQYDYFVEYVLIYC